MELNLPHDRFTPRALTQHPDDRFRPRGAARRLNTGINRELRAVTLYPTGKGLVGRDKLLDLFLSQRLVEPLLQKFINLRLGETHCEQHFIRGGIDVHPSLTC